MIVLASSARVELSQHEQASDPVFLRQAVTVAAKEFMAVEQVVMMVVFGCGWLEASHAVWILSSHCSNTSVRFFSCLAPELVVFPLQLGAEEFPPEFSMILMMTGPNSPFFPFLLSESEKLMIGAKNMFCNT